MPLTRDKMQLRKDSRHYLKLIIHRNVPFKVEALQGKCGWINRWLLSPYFLFCRGRAINSIDFDFNPKANQNASGGTDIGNLFFERRSWLLVEANLCVLCLEQANMYIW